MTKKNQKILIIRNDKIGDFALILPAVASLKKNIPNSKIVCLVSKNVEELAQQCEFIDEVIVDKKIKDLYLSKRRERMNSRNKGYRRRKEARMKLGRSQGTRRSEGNKMWKAVVVV